MFVLWFHQFNIYNVYDFSLALDYIYVYISINIIVFCNIPLLQHFVTFCGCFFFLDFKFFFSFSYSC